MQDITKFPTPFLADFARRQWVSGPARETWEPRIARIGAQFAAAERESVELGIRRAALQNITPDQLPELARKAAERGLTVTPLEMVGRPGSYSAAPAPVEAGRPWDYRVAITSSRISARLFLQAWAAGDDDQIGELLGYPKCCRRFFAETWAAGSTDPTWYMGAHGGGPLEANMLLRWAGVRYVPHMPCSFQCDPTVELGEQLRGRMPELERRWADALLSMPALWSARNSIGEVQTPLFNLNFRTDPAPELREIRRDGAHYPEHAAAGLRFPYRVSARAGSQGGLEPAAGRLEKEDPCRWLENGFGSRRAMLRAHRTVEAVRPSRGTKTRRTVLDLGCGNGRLARILAGPKGEGLAYGVEFDRGRARSAEQNLDGVLCSDIFSAELERLTINPDLILLMPGRLLEGEFGKASPGFERRVEFVKKLEALGGELVVYVYGDWIDKFESLEALCRAAGLEGELADLQVDEGIAAAGVWRFAC